MTTMTTAASPTVNNDVWTADNGWTTNDGRRTNNEQWRARERRMNKDGARSTNAEETGGARIGPRSPFWRGISSIRRRLPASTTTAVRPPAFALGLTATLHPPALGMGVVAVAKFDHPELAGGGTHARRAVSGMIA